MTSSSSTSFPASPSQTSVAISNVEVVDITQAGLTTCTPHDITWAVSWPDNTQAPTKITIVASNVLVPQSPPSSSFRRQLLSAVLSINVRSRSVTNLGITVPITISDIQSTHVQTSWNVNVPPGQYHIIATITDPPSLAFSATRVTDVFNVLPGNDTSCISEALKNAAGTFTSLSQTPSSTLTPSSKSSSSSGVGVGVIAGVVAGATTLVVLVLLCIWRWRRKRGLPGAFVRPRPWSALDETPGEPRMRERTKWLPTSRLPPLVRSIVQPKRAQRRQSQAERRVSEISRVGPSLSSERRSMSTNVSTLPSYGTAPTEPPDYTSARSSDSNPFL